MYRTLFIESFSKLGERLASFIEAPKGDPLIESSLRDAYLENQLFTPSMQREALNSILSSFLQKEQLTSWYDSYPPERMVELPIEDKVEFLEGGMGAKERSNAEAGSDAEEGEVLIVMAGNIPLVGFHDYLTAMAAGYRAIIKLSSGDRKLLPMIVELLTSIDPFWGERVTFIEELPATVETLIATGSDESAAFFEKRYRGVRQLIRGTKTAIAVIKGEESEQQLLALARDLFLYYGRGCRNVSTLLIPSGYNLDILMESLSILSHSLEEVESVETLFKYNSAVATMRELPFWSCCDWLFSKEAPFPPPPGVVALIEYEKVEEVESFIGSHREELQLVINHPFNGVFVPFGEGQRPAIDHYADGVDTFAFLLKLD